MLFAVLFMFIGAQFVGMGLLGEYIGRIYNDVRARPRYFIQRVVRQNTKSLKRKTPMKAVVFAYHDMGCAGLLALLEAGYDIAAIFTHPDATGENNLAPWRVLPPSAASRSTRRTISTTRCGWIAFVKPSRMSSSRSTTAT